MADAVYAVICIGNFPSVAKDGGEAAGVVLGASSGGSVGEAHIGVGGGSVGMGGIVSEVGAVLVVDAGGELGAGSVVGVVLMWGELCVEVLDVGVGCELGVVGPAVVAVVEHAGSGLQRIMFGAEANLPSVSLVVGCVDSDNADVHRATRVSAAGAPCMGGSRRRC